MDEPKQELSLFGKPIVNPVFNMTGPTCQGSAGVRPQLSCDPLNRLLAILSRYVGINALVTEIVDVWSQE